jgi:beta-lactam-binding protein with PASTA domain
VLTAATGTDIVPDLTDMSEDAAIKAVARSSFRFSVDPATSPTNKTVGQQRPEPGTAAPRGTEVVATFQ